MKIAIVALTTLLAIPFAQAAEGTFSGVCHIGRDYPNHEVRFSLNKGESGLVYFFGNQSEYRIGVANNIDVPNLPKGSGVLEIGIGVAPQKFMNPPILCPTRPASQRSECELKVAVDYVKDQYPHADFVVRTDNPGVPEMQVEDPDDPQVTVSTAVRLKAADVVPGVSLLTPTFQVDGVAVTCSGHLQR